MISCFRDATSFPVQTSFVRSFVWMLRKPYCMKGFSYDIEEAWPNTPERKLTHSHTHRKGSLHNAL